ncbi:MAG TPA: YIP1 family protein [Candidatus Limnocylindria bacterium]|nr:YIP1 family protein [Candidatus Limnocylindria bacterium]
MSGYAGTAPRFLTRAWRERFAATLRYALHVIVHPFDGFWDLTRERRGSIQAANFIVLLTLVTRILQLQYTSFLFIRVNWARINVFSEALSILVPLAIWCLANWSLTTLFEGKGRMRDIYMGTAYAMTPYPLIQLPLILLSNAVTVEEGAFYGVLSGISILWCGLLLVFAMMMIHDYTLGKAIAFMVMSAFGMMVIIFVILMFFSLINDGVAYFVSLYKELSFRLY